MHFTFLFTLLPSVLALCLPLITPVTHPLLTDNPDPSWEPALNTTMACNNSSDKTISSFPQLSTVLNDVCAAMMPACAYQDRAPADSFCVQTIDFELVGVQSSIVTANVEDAQAGNRTNGLAVKFSVIPTSFDVTTSAGIFWTKADCYGYFAHIAVDHGPAGCRNAMGLGIGNATVGGTSSLAGTMFSVEIVSHI